MRLHFNQKFLTVCVLVFLAVSVLAENTNPVSSPTNDTATASFLQLQEQLHAAQLSIQQTQQAAAEASKNNLDQLGTRLQSLEQTVATQRNNEVAATHKTLQTTLLLAGVFGVVCLGIMLAMVYLQSRAFAQLTQISAQQQTVLNSANAVQQLAAPGRATVDVANTKLLDVVEQLNTRLNELENGPSLSPAVVNGTHGTNGKPKLNGSAVNPLEEGQKYLDENAPQKALEFFDKFLAAQPHHAEALLKKADALEKLGRAAEALTYYNHSITADNSLAVAHLHKGGLLNRLRRYDEALNCYEQALQAQEKKHR